MPSNVAEQTRKQKVERLAELIWEKVCQPRLPEIRDTGVLTPTNSLRHRATRELLSWASQLGSGRWFTTGMVKAALVKIVDSHALEVPETTPGFSWESWYTTTSDSLSTLLSKARRSTVGSAPKSDDEAMDDGETQPWELDPLEDCTSNHFYRVSHPPSIVLF